MYNKGFTLIELMVSVTIFIIVMVISLGSLLSISAAERKAEALKSVMNNLNFALDSMSRSVRTGYDYYCPGGGANIPNCPSGDDEFMFEAVDGDPNDSGDQIVYRFETNASTCDQTGTVGCIARSINNGGEFIPITAPEVVITNLTFYLVGAVPSFSGESPPTQPKVTITIAGQIPYGTAQATEFELQTTVTQRLYDQ